jgi:putative selenate reductase
MSVGYDLEGIKSDKVTRFLKGMQDASAEIEALKKELTGDLSRFAGIEVPSCLSDCVTLSTFHGCPADEIESICHYLLTEVGVHVVVKMNPTLLGYGRVCEILNDQLGYTEIHPIEKEFDHDLQWDQALAMMDRLGKVAEGEGLTLGAKFTNTLVVSNHRTFFPKEDRMYMSGQPLYPISLSLALKFREAVGADMSISFSAGIDAQNFADAVASGLTPITTCTDLLRPGGYGRMFKYLKNLEKRMTKLSVSDIDGYILAAEGAREAGISDVREASLFNMRKVVERTLSEKRYTKAKNSSVPRKIGSHLVIFDCISCDKCIPVCPNDANFVYELDAVSSFTEEAFVTESGTIKRRPSIPFVIEREQQIGNYADFCNDCGNCDVFCPEDGGPYVEKPRFFGSKETFDADAKHGGFYLEASDDLVRAWARIDGRDYQLELERKDERAVFTDGTLELVIDGKAGVIEGMRSVGEDTPAGHVLSTHPARTMLAILRGVLDPERPNPVNAFTL